MDSEFGLVFYSYLSIGTLNLKFASGDPAGAFATLPRRPLPFVAKDGSQCSGLCYTVRRPLLLRRKGRLSVLMIRFRWVRANPLLLRRKVWLNPAYVEISTTTSL